MWDKLAQDQPILQSLPKEEGLLYELNNITKEVIETQLLASFDDDRILTITIEEFAADQKQALRAIAEFLEIPDIAGINKDATRANPDSGSWRNHFTPRLRDEFKLRYGDGLISLGYERDLDW